MFKLAIFLLDDYPYHSAIIIKEKKIADLSLLGSKIINFNMYDLSNYKSFIFRLNLKNHNQVINFLNKPMIISKKIIDKERSQRGWYKKKESADYILKFRNNRSRDLDDVNCIEWITYALEIGKYIIPMNVLTASQLFEWAKKNLNLEVLNETK